MTLSKGVHAIANQHAVKELSRSTEEPHARQSQINTIFYPYRSSWTYVESEIGKSWLTRPRRFRCNYRVSALVCHL